MIGGAPRPPLDPGAGRLVLRLFEANLHVYGSRLLAVQALQVKCHHVLVRPADCRPPAKDQIQDLYEITCLPRPETGSQYDDMSSSHSGLMGCLTKKHMEQTEIIYTKTRLGIAGRIDQISLQGWLAVPVPARRRLIIPGQGAGAALQFCMLADCVDGLLLHL